MFAKQEFKFDDKVVVKKGEVIEYIGNGAEDFFGVRIGGKPYTAYQDLWQYVDAPHEDQFVEDRWVLLTCQGGARAHIYLDDVRSEAPDGSVTFVPGISDGTSDTHGEAKRRRSRRSPLQIPTKSRGQGAIYASSGLPMSGPTCPAFLAK
jgi:hypothetical protein